MRTHFPLPAGCLLAAAAVLLLCPDARAITLRVGPGAGTPGSQCQHATPQEAIDALPADGQVHTVELSSNAYLGDAAAIEIDGRKVEIRARFSGNHCNAEAPSPLAFLIADHTDLPGGRTVVVRNGGQLTLENIEISGSSRGAISISNASVSLDNVMIIGNRAQQNVSGAGIVIEGGSLHVTDSLFEDNRTPASGGAIFCVRTQQQQTTLTLRDSRFLDNGANSGGAIYLFEGCNLTLSSAVFEHNQSDFDGGAVGTQPRVNQDSVRNTITLQSGNRFTGNRAGRDGGALQLSLSNLLQASPNAGPQFTGNRAQRAGGAVNVTGAGTTAVISGGRFEDNLSYERGGAIAVSDRVLLLLAQCAENGTVKDRHCARFERNGLAAPGPGPGPEGDLLQRGGTLYVGNGGILNVEGYAFRDSRGLPVGGADDGGDIAFVAGGGFLLLKNSLVFDSVAGEGDANLFQIAAGGHGGFEFNTIAGNDNSTAVRVEDGASASLAGNIIVENAAGVTGDGVIGGTCNNAQLGSTPPLLDPGFVTTPAGRYRLRPDSVMIARGLTCDPNRLPAGFVPPVTDLDGRPRVVGNEAPMSIDLGAFEFQEEDDVLFRNGFEPLPQP